ncbi:MAG: type II secretion system F family protein [Burkholderiaceae bacterium]
MFKPTAGIGMAADTAKQTSHLSPLSWQLRAELFAQLAAMEHAGLPTDRALELLRIPAQYQQRVAMMRKWLARGADLSIAGHRGGLFTGLESNLIAVASNAGSPASIYKRLAAYYSERAIQLRAIKVRLALPGFVFVIALFVQPLPALFSGLASPADYLLHCLGSLAVIAAVACLYVNLSRLHEGPPSELQTLIGRIAMAVPLFGKMQIRCNIRDFFESLALMLEAGMPILQALPKALDTMQLDVVKQAFADIHSRIEQGSTLTQALEDIPYLNNAQALALITTGEAAGSLPEMLFRYAAMETSAINDFNKQVADWLPRIIYAAIASWVAYGILIGSGVGHHVPASQF